MERKSRKTAKHSPFQQKTHGRKKESPHHRRRRQSTPFPHCQKSRPDAKTSSQGNALSQMKQTLPLYGRDLLCGRAGGRHGVE